jgi:hypothetical protein
MTVADLGRRVLVVPWSRTIISSGMDRTMP